MNAPWRLRSTQVLFFLTFLLLATTNIVLAQETEEPGIHFGVYDPEGEYDDVALSLERAYYIWTVEPVVLEASVEAILAKGRLPIISFESYPRQESDYYERFETLLVDTITGYYDQEITNVCRTLGWFSQQIIVSFAHEPEVAEGIFPWSGKDPDLYIAYYRHFVTTCRTLAPNAVFMWSPAGDSWLGNYWPGDEYVDIIGLTVLSYREFELSLGAAQPVGFTALFRPRYDRVAGYEKPIIIAEFSACCDQQHRQNWLMDAFTSFQNYPLLRAVILFNTIQIDGGWEIANTAYGGSNDFDLSVQDWRIQSNWFPPERFFETNP